MASISHHGDTVRIGALKPLAALCKDAMITRHLPLLAAASMTVAGPAVRNIGTIGGNIAGRNGCLLPALLALDASLEISYPGGKRRESLGDWLVRQADPNEIVEAVNLPETSPSSHWTTRKIGLRAAFTPSVIGIAGIIALEGERIVRVRLAVGGGIVPPARLITAEAGLLGLSWVEVDWAMLHERLMAEIVTPDDAFRSGRYRRLVAANAFVHGLGRMPKLAKRHRIVQPAAPSLAAEIRLSRWDQPQRWHIRP